MLPPREETGVPEDLSDILKMHCYMLWLLVVIVRGNTRDVCFDDTGVNDSERIGLGLGGAGGWKEKPYVISGAQKREHFTISLSNFLPPSQSARGL